ncbi:MAG: DUF655 domain-containing protein [Candidatus Thermoplasmatota archaeon]|jgi:putative nucleotide binding protein|nr:DUF655 domain-containing protein [Candidatus Thermoplasmatota archaeon]MCL5963469.1 DUF655 domain-containing protein [Candidatus Thermoplasmatota archaeon]
MGIIDKHEDYVYVIDFLPHGRMDVRQVSRDAIAYVVGESYFKLFEVILHPSVSVGIGDRIYIGKEIVKRKEVKQVKRRVNYDDITPTAQNQLEPIIKQIVENNEGRFVEFINNTQPISKKFHMLELLPGIGKKTMLSLVEEKRKVPFKSFSDIENRVHIHNLVDIFFERIKMELMDQNEKYHLFVSK